jgi:hypothetical protein
MQYGRYLRGTIEIIADGAGSASRPPYRGDSIFFWHGERAEMDVHYWSDAGAHGVMTGRVEGDRIVFRGIPSPGAAEMRTIWTRSDPDSFRVLQQRRDGEGWVDVVSVVYARAAPSATRR